MARLKAKQAELVAEWGRLLGADGKDDPGIDDDEGAPPPGGSEPPRTLVSERNRLSQC